MQKQKLKKKPPILNITSKNKITKNGKMDPEEHRLRVFNRENVPVMPELIIPSFTIKKDQMAKNILAYLVILIFIKYRKNTLLYLEDIRITNIRNVFKTSCRKRWNHYHENNLFYL